MTDLTENQIAFLQAMAAPDAYKSGRMPAVWINDKIWEVAGKRLPLTRAEATDLQGRGLAILESDKYEHVLASEWWLLDITDAGRAALDSQ